MKMPNWTPREDAEARQMLNRRTTEEEWLAFGRTRRAARKRMQDIRVKADIELRRESVEKGIIIPHRRGSPIPPEVIADYTRRLLTPPRDLTAAFCGDPKPGFSALERRA